MNDSGTSASISAEADPQGRLPSDAEIAEAYVTGRDTSDLAKTKAELAYMSMALDRELDIGRKLEAEIDSLRDRLDFAEFEWRRATDGMKGRDAEIGHLKEALEHATELLVDTWHTAMDGDPEKEAAVVDARAMLERRK